LIVSFKKIVLGLAVVSAPVNAGFKVHNGGGGVFCSPWGTHFPYRGLYFLDYAVAYGDPTLRPMLRPLRDRNLFDLRLNLEKNLNILDAQIPDRRFSSRELGLLRSWKKFFMDFHLGRRRTERDLSAFPPQRSEAYGLAAGDIDRLPSNCSKKIRPIVLAIFEDERREDAPHYLVDSWRLAQLDQDSPQYLMLLAHEWLWRRGGGRTPGIWRASAALVHLDAAIPDERERLLELWRAVLPDGVHRDSATQLVKSAPNASCAF
jgi:hypothetical protein